MRIYKCMLNVHKNQQNRRAESYRYVLLWEAFLDPSDSYFLFADFVDLYTHWTYMLILIVAEKNATKNEHICSMCIKINKVGKQEVGIWRIQKHFPRWEAFLDPSDSYFLFADFVDFFTHWTYMLIFRPIFLSNDWRQKCYIWSQTAQLNAHSLKWSI
jgi:hypothetical protein